VSLCGLFGFLLEKKERKRKTLLLNEISSWVVLRAFYVTSLENDLYQYAGPCTSTSGGNDRRATLSIVHAYGR
jgi:hypothetical protein